MHPPWRDELTTYSPVFECRVISFAEAAPIDPGQTYSADKVRFTDIPIHAYKGDLAAEIARWGKDGLRAALRHMLVVREFEHASRLQVDRRLSRHRYVYKGPRTCPSGRRPPPSAVLWPSGPQTDFRLAPQPWRDHRQGAGGGGRDDARRGRIHRQIHSGGRLLELVTRHVGEAGGDPAEAFLLTGVLAEIFMRDAGFNRGMGGSMHAFFTPFGAYPNNAIVGGSAGIAVGGATGAADTVKQHLCGQPRRRQHRMRADLDR